MAEFAFERLRRWPDVEAANLFAADATDRLITDESAAAVRAAPTDVVVINDHFGALTLGAIGQNGARAVRVHQDRLAGERALASNAVTTGLSDTYVNHPLDAGLVRGARVVLLQLPKSLAELREIAEIVAAHADPDVTMYSGGRVKHMTPTMNDVLRTAFTEVSASLARQKSRLLIARGPRPGVATSYPRREHHPDLDLWVCAHGAAFGGTKIDHGARLLLDSLDRMAPSATTAVDLGCGTGVLAAALARSRPALAVVATDESAAAVASTAATAEANGLAERITVVRDDAMAELPTASADLIMCNPPFHLGTSVHAGLAIKLFDAAARVLRPGGELWTVYNTPLGYRSALERIVGPTRMAGRNAKFTVTSSTAR